MKYLNQFHKEAMERTMKKIEESEKSPMSSIEAAKYMWRNFEMAKQMEARLIHPMPFTIHSRKNGSSIS